MVDWNHYRKIVNVMRKFGLAQQSKDVAALIRVASAIEQNDMPKAVHTMMTDLKQKTKLVGDG